MNLHVLLHQIASLILVVDLTTTVFSSGWNACAEGRPSSSGPEDVYSLLALGRQAVSLRMGVPLLHYATAGVLGQVWGTEATSHQCSYSTHHRPPGTT